MKRYNGTCKACGTRYTVLAASRATQYLTSEIFGLNRVGNLLVAGWSFVTDVDGYNHASHDGGQLIRACCDRFVVLKPVHGKVNPLIVCSAKCRASKGHVCECACGGKNHGAGK